MTINHHNRTQVYSVETLADPRHATARAAIADAVQACAEAILDNTSATPRQQRALNFLDAAFAAAVFAVGELGDGG
jgi:hypothetical protein